jgi:hypothetical protein
MHDDRESENSIQTLTKGAVKTAQFAGAVILALESFALAVYMWRQHRKFCIFALVLASILAMYAEKGCIPTDGCGFGPWDPVKQEYVHVPWYRDEFQVETASMLFLTVLMFIVGRDVLFMPDVGFAGMLRLSKASTKTRARLKRIRKAQEKLDVEMTQNAIVGLVREFRIAKLAADHGRRAEYRKRSFDSLDDQ